jgi:hypothetical protein
VRLELFSGQENLVDDVLKGGEEEREEKNQVSYMIKTSFTRVFPLNKVFYKEKIKKLTATPLEASLFGAMTRAKLTKICPR